MTNNAVLNADRDTALIDSIQQDAQTPYEPVVLPSHTNNVANQDVTQHTLDLLLSRPTLIASYVWGSTNNTELPENYSKATYDNYNELEDCNGVQQVFTFPDAILSKNKVVLEKVSAFKYIKSDIELEIKINASPFVQGCLLLSYLPYQTEITRLAAVSNVTVQGMTSCPNAKFVLGQTTTLKMIVPWINEFDSYDLTAPGNYYGTVAVSVLGALADGTGNPTASVNIFARFVNPEVRVPTNIPSVISRALRAKSDLEMIERYIRDHGFVAQISEGESSGPVSKIANTVTTVADSLGQVPVLGELAKPISWISRAVSGVASVFGFSKDANMSNTTFVDRVPGRGFTNTEGVENSVVLGSIPDNRVSSADAINTDRDQMALSSIFSHPNTFGRYHWTSQGAAFSPFRINSWPVHPTPYQQFGQTSSQMGSFGYVSSMAKYWRGTIVYTLTFLATKFHQGRVMAVYFPEGDTVDTPENGQAVLDLISSNYHQIIDLSTINTDDGTSATYTFSIPYTRNQPWSNTCHPRIGTIATDVEDFNGVIGLYCINDLVCPETCSGTVEIIADYRGGPDFELAMPRSVFPIGWLEVPVPPEEVFVAEIDNGATADRDSIVNPMIPDVKSPDAREACMGEYFESLRAFAKRFVYLRPLQNIFNIYPGWTIREGWGRVDNDGFPLAVTPLEQVQNLFRFSAGSIRYKVQGMSTDNIRSSWVNDDLSPLGVEHITHGTVNNCHEVTVPYYGHLRLKSHNSGLPTLGDKQLMIERIVEPTYGAANSTTEVASYDEANISATKSSLIYFTDFSYKGFNSAYTKDLYIEAHVGTLAGTKIVPMYEHNQWIRSSVVIGRGDFVRVVNNSANDIEVNVVKAEVQTPCPGIYEAAGDDFSASFMVPPCVISTRDYQTL